MNRRCIHQIEPPAQGMELIDQLHQSIVQAEEKRRARQPVPEGMGSKWGQSGSQAQANEVADAKLDQLRQGTPYPSMQLAAAIVEQMPEPWREEPSGSLVPAGNGAQSPPPLDLQLPAAAPLSVVRHIPESTAWNRPPEFIGAGTPESERILKGIKGLPYGPSPVSAVPPPPAAQAQANGTVPLLNGFHAPHPADSYWAKEENKQRGRAKDYGKRDQQPQQAPEHCYTVAEILVSAREAISAAALKWGPEQEEKLGVSMFIEIARQGRLRL
jgi:hypothetical protein